jgi:hypothetical protein
MGRVQQRRDTVSGDYPVSVGSGELGVNIPDQVVYFGNESGDLVYPIAVRPFTEDGTFLTGTAVFKDGDILVATTDVSPGVFSALDWSTISLSPDASITGEAGWDFSVTYNAESLVSEIVQSKGAYWVRQTISYTAESLVDTVLMERSTDSGANYSTVGTITLSYNGDGLITGGTWS